MPDYPLADIVKKLSRNCAKLITFTFDRASVGDIPISFRHKIGEASIKVYRTSNKDCKWWHFHSHGISAHDCPLDMDELAVFAQNFDFTLDPSLHPRHLHNFVPKMPDSKSSDFPEKNMVVTCFCKTSSFSPIMTTVFSTRNTIASYEDTWDPSDSVRVWNSDCVLLNNYISKLSILHAVFYVCSEAYSAARDINSKVNLVDASVLGLQITRGKVPKTWSSLMTSSWCLRRPISFVCSIWLPGQGSPALKFRVQKAEPVRETAPRTLASPYSEQTKRCATS